MFNFLERIHIRYVALGRLLTLPKDQILHL